MSVKSLEKKQMNFAAAVETEESLEQRPDVQDVWDGLIVWHPNMAAECRELQT